MALSLFQHEAIVSRGAGDQIELEYVIPCTTKLEHLSSLEFQSAVYL
jgi:hypothetical protein